MNKQEFEKVFAAAAEKSGVPGIARSCFFAKNLQRMMIDLRDKLYPAEQQSDSLDNFIQSLLETCPTNKNEVPKEALNDYHQGLICGARKTYNWLLESAIDATCVILPPPDLFKVLICHEVTDKLADKQKIKILIVKEDK